MHKIYEIGINDYNEKVKIGGIMLKSYTTWIDMIKRCYSKKFQEKRPTYVGCAVCDEWLSFSKFKEWYDENYPRHLEEQGVKLQLDKDLLSGDNKIYSPDTCVFLPNKVNKFISNSKNTNKTGTTGVCWHNHNNSWVSQITDYTTRKIKHIGYFTNIEDAKYAYDKARTAEAEKVKEYLRELGYDEKIIDKIK